MKISIIGAGYVGLVTGACLAELGHDVLCIDNDENKVRSLRSGHIPIYEPGLDQLVQTHSEEGRLHFSTSIEEAVEHGKIIFICVQTPPKEHGGADLSAVDFVSKQIAAHLTDYRLIVEKSTVPVQTGSWVQETIKAHIKPGVEFDVASNPEFLREGTAVKDFLHPDRVVIGTDSERAVTLLVKLYEPLNAPLLLTDIKSAELIKHSANAFLAMKISFINAVSQICERSGADVTKVAMGIGMDSRIGLDFLHAGIGWGGSCFPKDLAAYIHIADTLGYDFRLLRIVDEINQHQRVAVVDKLEKALGKLDGTSIAVWGLAFKPNTDDLRGAPSIDIVKALRERGAEVRAHDPVSMEKAREYFPGTTMCKDPYEAAEGCDAVVLVTEWAQYRALDMPRVKRSLSRPVLVDGRNLFDPGRMRSVGFDYYGIGRT
ncbi:MAG TPA: UDP-glucose/GDP-mannose dehydrogenase family protein [Candidatus Xenobia bacterium]|jgi:UDPglucose 6-dehydrogenase